MKGIENTKRICLWSGPRNISTALMYSFAQRNDTKVMDEPLYSYYLSNTDAANYHPGSQEIIDSMEKNGEEVVKMMTGVHEKPVVFFKNMTHHLLDLNRDFMDDVVNVILTRDPVEMLPSFGKVIKNPTMEDVGYQLHIDLLNHLDKRKAKTIVLDSKKVLLNPSKTLSDLCQAIDIQFDEKMLSWSKGARKEDGVWAKYWYDSIHNSTGFMKYKQKEEPFPVHLKILLNECQPFYNELIKRSL